MNTRAVSSAEDGSFLLELYASTRGQELSQWGFGEPERTMFIQMQFTAQQRSYESQYPNLQSSIILHEGQKAGRILIARCEQEWVLVDISLLPMYQNKGIGTHLITELLEEACHLGVPVRLSVLGSNLAAQRLYERLGFNFVARNEPYIRMEWRKEQE